MVLRLFVNDASGTGLIVGPSTDRTFPGCYKVDVDGLITNIHPDRIKDEAEYWNEIRDKRVPAKPPRRD